MRRTFLQLVVDVGRIILHAEGYAFAYLIYNLTLWIMLTYVCIIQETPMDFGSDEPLSPSQS